MSLSQELVYAGNLDLKDLRLHKINRRLAETAQSMHTNYQEAINTSEQVFREFSKKFLIQAKALTWTGLIPLAPDALEARFKKLSIQLIDPIRSGSTDPEFDFFALTIRIPIPVIGGTFSYTDFVHEALHGIAGRHTAHVILRDDGQLTDTATEVIRSGLRFTLPHMQKDRDLFEWLNEGLVEHLVSFFVAEENQENLAYVDEVDIIRALTAPEGLYRIPLGALTAAYFAHYDPSVPVGIRYPEWHDLTQVFPTREMAKISRLIEQHGAEETLEILTSQNIFDRREAKLSR
jgi:predicted house-cleaning noncanonical NTP pyrophosphatase (MazG superfamily)